jgi:transcriptional regulator with XRE-family HTH domain
MPIAIFFVTNPATLSTTPTMNMHDFCDPLLLPQPDTRVTLDARRLLDLRRERGLSREAVSEQSLEQHKCLSVASITRAESSKPVLYLTARYLAEFYDVPLQTLLPPGPATTTPGAPQREPRVECLQFGAALDAVLLTGRGSLVDACGAAGAGKSRLLAQCLDIARRRGFTGIELRVDKVLDDTIHPLRTLMLGLLRLDPARAAAPEARAALAAEVRTRCQVLDLAGVHVAACEGLLDGAHAWPRPASQRTQAMALCALIRALAMHEPLVLALDDLHHADWVLAMTLEIVIPATLSSPVLWIVTSAPFPGLPAHGTGARLDGVARTVFYLPAPPPAAAEPVPAGA